LSGATGVPLSLAEEPKEGKVVFGSMSGKAPVWKYMQQIAATQITDGKWEKSGNGYVLRGVPKVVISPKKEIEQAAAKKAFEAAIAEREAAVKKFHPLAYHDQKLHTRLSVVEKDAKLADLLGRLAKCTGYTFALAENLGDHEPKLTGLQLPNIPAASLMELIAKRDLDKGQWTKTETGYQLEGVSRKTRPAAPGYRWGRIVAGLSVSLLAAVGLVILYRTGRKNRQTKVVSQP
jgi:hypothetical protein